MIKTVIRLTNDMVMVFDTKGEQVPEYQGQYQDVRERIMRAALPGTVFNHWFGHRLTPRALPVEKW